jgi:hypothetical protein
MALNVDKQLTVGRWRSLPMEESRAFLPRAMDFAACVGRDAFHCVPDSGRKNGDAVERVPTRFRGSTRELARRILSPLRGEGDTFSVRRPLTMRGPIGASWDVDQAPSSAANVATQDGTPLRAPSPLNGERAGVRGEAVRMVSPAPRIRFASESDCKTHHSGRARPASLSNSPGFLRRWGLVELVLPELCHRRSEAGDSPFRAPATLNSIVVCI